jgi:C-terminal peptidase prc
MALDPTVATAFAEKVLHAARLISKEYVKDVKQVDLIATAIKGLYQRVEEKLPPDIKERLDKARELEKEKKLASDDLLGILADARTKLGNREDLDNHKDLDYALQRMMGPLDPYTTYIDPETLSQFKRETSGNFNGIGIQIRADSVRDRLVVITPIKDSPAYHAGVQAGDVILQIKVKVDGKGKPLPEPEIIDTKGLDISDAVKRIGGKAGTQVELVIEREGLGSPKTIPVTRGLVEVETVLGARRKADDSWDYYLDPKSKICYARLTSFANNTERDLTEMMNKLNTKGINGFILDLRSNPGGLLDSAVNISDLFIDDGLIVTVKARSGRERPFFGQHEDSFLDFPMVCLVNDHSASGSEIVSACLQDQNRALIVGERSYGKGSVQNIQPFEEGELKLTTASFWRPNGKNLNKSSTKGREDEDWGVIPDKVVKLTAKERVQLEAHFRQQEIIPRKDLPATAKDEEKGFEDKQLKKALEYLRDQMKLAAKVSTKKAD